MRQGRHEEDSKKLVAQDHTVRVGMAHMVVTELAGNRDMVQSQPEKKADDARRPESRELAAMGKVQKLGELKLYCLECIGLVDRRSASFCFLHVALSWCSCAWVLLHAVSAGQVLHDAMA